MFRFSTFFSPAESAAPSGQEHDPEEHVTIDDNYVAMTVREFENKRVQSSETYGLMVKELEDFSVGQGDELIKGGRYRGLTRADFRKLLEAVKGAAVGLSEPT